MKSTVAPMLFLQAQARCLSENALSHEGAKERVNAHGYSSKKKNLNRAKKVHEKYSAAIKRAGIRPHNKSILNKRY